MGSGQKPFSDIEPIEEGMHWRIVYSRIQNAFRMARDIAGPVIGVGRPTRPVSF